MKKYRFFYHWRKCDGRWTVHFRGKCITVDKLECRPLAVSKSNKRQPRAVMQGFTEKVNTYHTPEGLRVAVIH